MNFNKHILAVVVSSSLVVGAAHAAMSNLTPPVVGHMPTIVFNGAIPAAIELGNTLTYTDADLTFSDADNDAEAQHSFMWQLDGSDTGNVTLTYPLELAATSDIGKHLTLVIIPKTSNGDPKEGNPVVVDFGLIAANSTALPSIDGLAMTGTLQLNEALSATYTFNANGGNPTDKSTYAWGRVGMTVAAVESGASVADAPIAGSYTLTANDVGEVVELSVQAKNGVDAKGNVLTVDSLSQGLLGGGTDGAVVDPSAFDVRVVHNASGTADVNGPNFAGRPVVGADAVKAECKYTAAPEADFAICDISSTYNLRWKATSDGVNFTDITDGVSGATYLPHASHQGMQIAADVELK